MNRKTEKNGVMKDSTIMKFLYSQHSISNKRDMKGNTITWNKEIINFWFRSARWTKINSEQLNLNFEPLESQNDKGGLRVLSRSWRLSA